MKVPLLFLGVVWLLVSPVIHVTPSPAQTPAKKEVGTPLLSPEQLRKLLKFMDENPIEANTDGAVLTAIGIPTPGDKVLKVRQVIYKGDGGIVFLFNKLPNGDYAFLRVQNAEFCVFRTTPRLQIVGAAAKKAGADIRAMPARDLQKELQETFKAWRAAADTM